MKFLEMKQTLTAAVAAAILAASIGCTGPAESDGPATTPSTPATTPGAPVDDTSSSNTTNN